MRGRNPVPVLIVINSEADVELKRPQQWTLCDGASKSFDTQSLNVQLHLVIIVGYIDTKVQQVRTHTENKNRFSQKTS